MAGTNDSGAKPRDAWTRPGGGEDTVPAMAEPELSDAAGFFAQVEEDPNDGQVQVKEDPTDEPSPTMRRARPDPPFAPRATKNGRGKWIVAGVVLAVVLEAAGFAAWWGWGEYQEYLASRPPDLFDVDSPAEAVAGESIGSARTLDYGDLDDWSRDAEKVETRTVYALRATGVHTQDLVAWTQKDGEAPKDEILGAQWTWLFTASERAEWPLQDDIEVCGSEGNLVAWSKVDTSDGLVRVTRTGTDGASKSTIESVEGGAYWCSFIAQDGKSHSLEMRWYPGAVITTPVDHGEPVTTRKVQTREVVSGIKLAIDHKD